MKIVVLDTKDIGKGSLILVNSLNPMRQEIISDSLTFVNPSYPKIAIERQTLRMLRKTFEAICSKDNIVPVSGYRSTLEQKTLYEASIRENGREFTEKFVALPSCSEHETGLAIDLGEKKKDIDYICPSFPYTGICQSFRKNSIKYGFIERYPKGREKLTNIEHEPWHFRYVGYPHSEIMEEKKLTLEEYIDYVKGFSENNCLEFYTHSCCFKIYYVKLTEGQAKISIPDKTLYTISGNNVDGFVVTLWRNER